MCHQAANSRGTLVDKAELKCQPWRVPFAVADLRPKFYVVFFGKLGKIVCWRLPGGLAPPPMGNPGSPPPLISIQYTHTQVFLTRNNACGLSGAHQYASDSCGSGLTYYDTSTYHITIPFSQLHSQKHLLQLSSPVIHKFGNILAMYFCIAS